MILRISTSRGALVLFLLGSLVASVARAQWTPAGVPVCFAPGTQDRPLAAPNDAGGAFIVWRDFRNGQESDLYAQHITSSGKLAPGWPKAGAPVCTAPLSQATHVVAADGLGGVIVAWEDQRDAHTTGTDIYALRILANGELAPGWPQDGLVVCQAAEDQRFASLVSDGAGGAIIAWTDYRNGNGFYNINPDIYALRITDGAEVAVGWPPGGLSAASTPGDEIFPRLVPSGEDGVIVTFQAGVLGGDIHAQRLMGNGTIDPSWPPSGAVLCSARDYQVLDAACGDGAGGAFAAWRDYRSYPGFGNSFPWLDVYAQYVTAGGQIAVGWPLNGFPLSVEPGGQLGIRMVADGSGGFLATWNDYRTGEGEIYAHRLLAPGAPAPGWAIGGQRVSNLPGPEFEPTVSADGSGGAYFAFQNWTNRKIYGQHLSAAGAVVAGWPQGGAPVSDGPGGEETPSLVRSGSGAIVAWETSDIYAQKLVIDGPVPALVSLISAEARPDEVLLRWHSAEGLGGPAIVSRREVGRDPREVAAVSADGGGFIEYRDLAVVSGLRYGYRLTYASEGGRISTEETWVDVPAGIALTLDGFRPNPVVGESLLSFGLASGEPATLELFDSAGRRLVAEDVGSMGAGPHVVRLAAGKLIPGVYWMRLQQGATNLVRRGVVVR